MKNGRQSKKVSLECEIVGETTDTRCFKVIWPGSRTPTTYHKSFIEIIDKPQTLMDKQQALEKHMQETFPKGSSKVTVLKGRRSWLAGWEAHEAESIPTGGYLGPNGFVPPEAQSLPKDAEDLQTAIEEILDKGYENCTEPYHDASTTDEAALIKYCLPRLLKLFNPSGAASQVFIQKQDKNFYVRFAAMVDRKMKETGVWDKILKGCKHFEEYEKLQTKFFDALKAVKLEDINKPPETPPPAGPVWVKAEDREPDESGKYIVRMHCGSIAPKVVVMESQFTKQSNGRSLWSGAMDWNFIKEWLDFQPQQLFTRAQIFAMFEKLQAEAPAVSSNFFTNWFDNNYPHTIK